MNTTKANTKQKLNRTSMIFTFVLAAVLLAVPASAQVVGEIYISNVTGLIGQDTLTVGQEITWTLTLHNLYDGEMVAANNGFRVFSPDGATWTPITIGQINGAYDSAFSPGNVFPYVSANNTGSGTTGDTVGIGGFDTHFPCVGLPVGYEAPALTVTIPGPGIDASSHGKTICIDSSGYAVNFVWLWGFCDGGGGLMHWGSVDNPYGGPVCYTVVDPNAPTESNLIVDPQTLSFSAIEGDANPASQLVDVSSDGDPLDFTLAKDSAWLNTSNSGGTTPTDFMVSVDITGLAPGVYVDTIDVTSLDAANSPQYVEVTLTVNAALKFLNVTPNPLSFTAQEGASNPVSQDFEVSEVGGFNIPYTLTENSSWFSLNKAGGTTTDTVSVNVDISGLTEGTYTDSIEVASAGIFGTPVYEVIILEVTPAPMNLEVDPDTLHFTGVQDGANPQPDTFSVSETGGGSIDFALNETATWFSINKTSGTTPDDIEVSVDLTGVTQGSYLDSIEVSSGDADNSPVWEYVHLTVAPPEPDILLDVTPDSLFFTAQQDGANPANQNFGIIESGGGNIAYTLSEDSAWLSLNKAGGNTPDVVIAMIDITGLPPGTYYADVTVASGVADNSPVTEVICLTVAAIPKFIMASPNSIGPNMTAGGPPFSPITIHVTDSFEVGLAYDVFEDVDWLNISPNSGTTADSFWVIADTMAANALLPGFYLDTITITSSGADNSSILVYASLEVLEAPNTPPTIDIIPDYTMNEGEHLEASFAASDSDGDALTLFSGPLPSFASFGDTKSITSGTFYFDPGYNDAGEYEITAYATDGKDTTNVSFTLTVIDTEPGTEGDTLHVATVPAVPGQQVTVPVDMANSCNVFSVSIPFWWEGAGYIKLDSGVFNDSLVGHISNKYISFDNDADTGQIWVEATGGEDAIPPGHDWLIQLYYSVTPETPHGAYAVTPLLTETLFGRDCGGGMENIIPVIPGGGGGIVVDTTNVYVCGYVIDEDSLGIPGASVELWADYPCDGPHLWTTTNGDGAYAFTGFQLGSFDLYAYKWGEDTTNWNDSYYPTDAHVNFGENAIGLLLPAVQSIKPSDVWVDYFCDVNTLFGCDLPVGSIVEASDPDGTICGRQFVRAPGIYKFMPVYRDSSGSVEDEGAVTGDNIRFHINGVEALASGNTIYPAAYDTMRVCLAGGERLTKECQLVPGWNLVSWNLNTDTDDIEEVLNSLDGCIDVVLGFEQGGLTYVPGMNLFNTLSAVDHLSGYWIKIKSNCSPALEISGVSVDQDFPIGLWSGWNLISYLPNDPHPIATALYSIENNFQIAYTYDATPLVFVPGMDTIFNTLDEMEPCFGYWIKVNEAGVLTYPSADGPDSVSRYLPDNFVTKDVSDRKVEPTRNWVNLYSQNLTLDGAPVSAGSEITAHNAEDGVIGYFEMKESATFGFMPVYADESGESAVGIHKGESFYLSVDGVRTKESYTWTDQGALIEVAALNSINGSDILPKEYSLSQNYPNPFNPTTTISFSLPVASKAKIEIFNLLGQLVATPFDGDAVAGEHKVVWDGRSTNSESAASGIYLYRLVIDDENVVEKRKMTLIK